MTRRQTPPPPMRLGHIRASVMASRGQDAVGRWYWRVRTSEETLRGMRATEPEAAAELARLVHEHPMRSSRERREVIRTVDDLARAWYDHQVERCAAGHIRDSSLASYRRHTSGWCGSGIADVVLTHLTLDVVQREVLAWEAHGGVGRRTARTMARALQSMLRWGAQRGHCPSIDMRGAVPPAPREGEYVYTSHTPTHDEVRLILEAMPPGGARDYVHLLALTGARRGEVAVCLVSDYDGRSLRFAEKTSARRVPVAAAGELRELLDRMTEGRAPTERLAQVSRSTMRAHLVKACDAAGVPQTSAHGLRRAFIWSMLRRGIDVKHVSRITGHSVQTLLESYVRPSDETLLDAMSRTALAFEGGAQVIQLHAGGSTSRARLLGTGDDSDER